MDVANYGIPYYPDLPEVRGSPMPTSQIFISTNNPLAAPGSYNSKHKPKCKTCSRCPGTASSNFSRVLIYLPYLYSLLTVPCRRTKTITLATLLGTLATSYQALASLPFLVHRSTAPPRLASSLRQRTCDNSRAVACTTPVHRLIWFEWNQAPLGDLKW
jgi:hypothetical protein